MPILFKCKACGAEQVSPIGFATRKAFESSVVHENSFQCSTCTTAGKYDKKDFYWRDSPPAN